jgi:hypothetical protein
VVEVNLDPAGPPVHDLLAAFRAVQAVTRLEVLGTEEQIAALVEDLAPAGSAYWVLEATS